MSVILLVLRFVGGIVSALFTPRLREGIMRRWPSLGKRLQTSQERALQEEIAQRKYAMAQQEAKIAHLQQRITPTQEDVAAHFEALREGREEAQRWLDANADKLK